MSDDLRLDTMRLAVSRLSALLDDAQPGLFTWHDFVRTRVDEIHDVWYGAEHCVAHDRSQKKAK